MRSFDVIILTPSGLIDPSLAIAACRAGERGFLDLEYAPSEPISQAAIDRLERFTSIPFGIKLGRDSGPILDRLTAHPVQRLAWVLLAGGDHPELERWIKLCRTQQIEVLFEATALAEALRGVELGVDGLVLKGQE